MSAHKNLSQLTTILGTIQITVLFLASLLWPTVAGAAADTPSAPEVIQDDALTPPDADRVAAALQNAPPSGQSSGSVNAPGYYQTSDYLIGHVAVGLILPESDGRHEAQSEDWTDQEVAQVQTEVQDALDWWASLEPAAHLTFTVEFNPRVPTGYEPITHRLGEEKLWIGEAMAALGFGDDYYFSAVREYVNALRDNAGADWAFAIFVVDSSADVDGRFGDNYFAYAYLGGPFMVMTYDNSSYQIQNMDAVTAHEIGHIFRALDQYAAAGARCEYRAGYLDVENGNSLAGGDCDTDQPSIMRGGIFPYQTRAIDPYARGQLGWQDSDGDGVLDPVDAPPRVTATLDRVEGANDDLFRFRGQAWQDPVPSPTLVDATINRIAAVGALVDGTSWTAASPTDGQFDSDSEVFELGIGPLAPGLHTVEIQALNSERLASTAFVTTTFVYDPLDGALTSSLGGGPATASGDGPIQLDGTATAAYGQITADSPTVAAVEYQVDGGAWQQATAADGRFDSAIENFQVVLDDLPDGSHTLTVRTVNSDGRAEVNVTTRQFEIATTHTIFIPMVRN